MEKEKKYEIKKRIIIPAIINSAVLLIPVPQFFKDGGTVKYSAILYSVTKAHCIAYDTESKKGGYMIGTEVRVLDWVVYDDVKFVPDD